MAQETMEKATVTKEDVVQYTINILTGIQIPVMQSDTIGTAIKSAVNNLIVLQEMMQEEKAGSADADPEDGSIPLFPENEEPKEDENGNAEV